jgi:hypothetical protein
MPKTRPPGELAWFFEAVGQMGGASSSAYQNSLAGVGVMPAQLFARETIQNSANSVDAAQEGAPSVSVRFRSIRITRPQLGDLRTLLHMNDDDEPLRRRGLVPSVEGSTLHSVLEEPPRLLYVEDFNTVGLGGTTEPIALSANINETRSSPRIRV